MPNLNHKISIASVAYIEFKARSCYTHEVLMIILILWEYGHHSYDNNTEEWYRRNHFQNDFISQLKNIDSQSEFKELKQTACNCTLVWTLIYLLL